MGIQMGLAVAAFSLIENAHESLTHALHLQENAPGSPPPGEPVLRPGDYGCTDVRRGAEVFYSKEKAKVQEVFFEGGGSVSGQPNYPEVNDDKRVSQE